MEFDEFYREEVHRVLRTCWLVTLDDQAATDIAQEAMLRAWLRWEHLRLGDPGAWVRAVALNLGRSRWRRLRREARPARRLAVASEAAATDPDLLAALRRLPHRQREAVVLFYWADLSVAGCAAAMGVSEGSVKQHLRRARTALGADAALQFVDEPRP